MAQPARKTKPEADTVVLINRDRGRKYIPHGEASKGGGGRLGIVGPATGVATLHLIHPGINKPIERAFFEELCENPTLKAWLDDQTIYELTEPMGKMNPDSCGPLLERSSDVDGLKCWLKHENRKEWKDQLREIIMAMEKHAAQTAGMTGEPD